MKDQSTRKRFELYGFSKEHLRSAYHENCDYSKYCDEELQKKIEGDVRAWLDDNGAESSQLQIDLKPGSKWLLFNRSEVAMKTASNNWEVYHVAQSLFWPRLISSKPKLLIQHPGELVKMRNEIRSFNYDQEEVHFSRVSEALINGGPRECSGEPKQEDVTDGGTVQTEKTV